MNINPPHEEIRITFTRTMVSLKVTKHLPLTFNTMKLIPLFKRKHQKAEILSLHVKQFLIT